MQQRAQNLIENAVEGLDWYISSIPEKDTFQKTFYGFDELKEHIVLHDDPLMFEAAASYIEKKFEDGKRIVKVLKTEIKDKRQQAYDGQQSASDLPIYIKDNVYYKKLSQSAQRISNFLIEIKDRVLQDDVLFYRCNLTSVDGEVAEEILFSPAERVEVRKFRVLVAGRGDFHFNGRDHELSGVWQLEQAKAEARMIMLIQSYGRIPLKDLWLFHNCVIKGGKLYELDSETEYIKLNNLNMRSEDVQVYANAFPFIDVVSEYSKKFSQDVATKFNEMLDSSGAAKITGYMGYLFMGFIPATIYSDEIFAKYGVAPFLFPYGPSGTGKSTATELLMAFFGFQSGTRENFGDASVPGIAQAVSQLSSIPYWMDEFSTGIKFETFKETLKNIYNRVGTGKGGRDGKRLIRDVRATLWLSGQYLPDDEAVISRSVILRFKPTNSHKNKAFKWLGDHKSQLSCITRELILRKDAEQAKILLGSVQHYIEFLESKGILPRYAINYAIIAASLQMLDIDIPDDFEEFLYRHATETLGYAQDENEALVFFKEMNIAWTQVRIPKKYVYYNNMDHELAIRFDGVMAILQAETRKRGMDGKLKKSNLIKDYLKDIPGFVSTHDKNGQRRRFREGDKLVQRPCVVFDCRLLPDKFKLAISELLDDFSPKE